MSTMLTVVFGVACFTAGVSLFAMWLHRRPVEVGNGAPGGKRVDQTRRDQVQELIDASALLLANYRFRNWLIAFVFSVLIAVNALGLRSTGQSAMKAQDAAGKANTAIVRVDAVAKESRAVAAVSRRVAIQTTTALCTFVGDLKNRVEDQKRKIAQTDKFLRDNPNGIGGFGPALFRQSIKTDKATLKNQRATIRSFTALDCPAP